MRSAAAGRLLQPRKTVISRVNLAQVVAQFLQKYLATFACLVRRDARIVRYPGGISMAKIASQFSKGCAMSLQRWVSIGFVNVLELVVISATWAGAVSDFAFDDTVSLRSYVEARFHGNNFVGSSDSATQEDVLTTPAVGVKSTSASASIVPAGVHNSTDMATGMTSLSASLNPGGVDVLSFDVSGFASAINAHNLGGFEADGEVAARSYISWFVDGSPIPNKVVAGKLRVPALPATPEGVTLTMSLEQHNCCPTTFHNTAPHPAFEIGIFHGYGYTLTLDLKVIAPFGDDGVFSYELDIPLEVENHQRGDYNKNGVVDAADYVVWRNTLGQLVRTWRPIRIVRR